MTRDDMEQLIRWLDPAKKPVLVQFPEAQLQAVKKELRLP
jgi:hypothetical protein